MATGMRDWKLARSTRSAVLTAVAMVGAAFLPTAMLGQTDGVPQSGQNTNLPSQQQGYPGQPGAPGTSQTMRDTLGAPGATGQEMADKQFVRKAAEGGIAMVQMGMLAAKHGSPDIQTFGQKMVTDHTGINTEMKSVADTIGEMLPKKMDKESQAEYDKLKGLSGDAFDKEYIAYMVKDHRQDFRDFRTEATVAADPTLQALVVKALGVIREHLMLLTKLAADKGVTLPPRPARPMPPPAGL
jgi:putative membrane protein